MGENLSKKKKQEILDVLKAESNGTIENKVIQDYSEITSILELGPNASKEEKRKLISKLEMLQDPNISTAEKAIIIEEILRLKENLSNKKKQEILDVLKAESNGNIENKVIQDYSEIASILGLPPNSSKEEKRNSFQS